MPAHLVLIEVRRLIDEKGPQEARTLAPKLAARFDVSASAMEFRLANLGLATSFWKGGDGPTIPCREAGACALLTGFALAQH
jgi:hypothetical protein